MEPFSKKTSPTEHPARPAAAPRRRAALLAVCATLAFASMALAVAAEEAGPPAPVAVAPVQPAASPATPKNPAAQAGDPAAPATPATGQAAAPVAQQATPAVEPASEPAAEAGEGGKGAITVESDTLEVEKNDGGKVRATGNVIIEWDTTKLRADVVKVDKRERRIEASGNVVYESDDMRATASDVVVDADDETGVLDHVEMHLDGEDGRFGGERLEKAEGRRVILDDGYFTTCETDLGHPPDWELRGKHLDVRLDNYARMTGARFEVRGVPVLYLPYMVFPTKQTRQSGLLPFSFGTSTNRGILFSLPGYWAIDKSQDLTMTAVVETSARLGVDGIYRYAPSNRRWGELHASYYNEEIRGDPKPNSPAIGVPVNRGSVELIHREYGQGWTGYADIRWVGDNRFLREVNSLDGDTPERDKRRTRRYTTSKVGAMMNRGFTTGIVEATAYQTLVGTVIDDSNPATSDPVLRDTQQKPLQGWLKTDRNLGPVAFAFDSSIGSFLREKGASGERIDVASTFALPLLVDGPVLSHAWARGRASVYAMQERNVLDESQTVVVDRLDTFPTRGVFEGGIDARSKFARDYTFTELESWSGLYHTLEPFAALRYSNRSTYDSIPLFDRLDAIDGRDVATYGIDSRFLLRHRPGSDESGLSPFEFGRVSLSQSYNLSTNVVDDNFSDIDLSAFVQPLPGLALRTLTSYNVGAGEVRGANASVSWETGPFGPLLRGKSSQIAAAYRYVRNDTAGDVLQSTEMLARLAFTKNFALGLKGLYDIVSNSFIEKAIGVTFTSSCDCWSVGLGVVDRVNPSVTGAPASNNERSPEELQVRIAFELSGLGGFGSGVTQRSSPALDSVEYDDVGFWRAGW